MGKAPKFRLETFFDYPGNVVPALDQRRTAVRDIMGKAGILKEAK